MPNVRVNPIQTISVRVNQQNQPVVSSTTQFVAATDAQAQIDYALQQANVAVATATQASEQANTIIGELSNYVSKSGSIMTDPLYFNTTDTGVGNIQNPNGVDLYASGSALWAQLNFANTNFVYVDTNGAYLQTANTAINAVDSTGAIEVVGQITTSEQTLDGGTFS